MGCTHCRWADMERDDGGWCYMFKEQPSGYNCGQFKESENG